MSTREQRGYQMFPVLDGARVETALCFASGPERHFAPGEMLYDHGQQGAPAWLVLSGSVDITRRDGLDREAPVVTFGPGQFTGEVNQFAGRPAITRARNAVEGRNSTMERWDLKRLSVFGTPRSKATLFLADVWNNLPTLARLVREASQAALTP